jgi:endonuclease/exonuclease/phosphatase (EEP) superfamily protein YafD
MTYNIKSYRAVFRRGGFVPLNDEIAQHQPDILVMQDAREVSRRGDLPYGMRDVLPQHKLYAYGQYAVASRFPLSGCAPADMSLRDEKHEYVRCTVDIDGTRIDLVTAHLLTPREGLNATREERLGGLDDWHTNFADRMTQADRIASALVPLRRPTIVAGDLNAPEHSAVVQTLLGIGLRNAFSAAGRGWGYTHGHSLKPGLSFLRIDHILVSPEIGVRDAWVGWRGGSEHRPVVADLVIALPTAKP